MSLSNEELTVLKKMAAIGTMTASVVHEIKNPVALIHGLSEQLQDGELPAPMVEKIGGKIEKSALKILDIVKSVQSLVHGQSSEMVPGNLEEIINDAVEFSKKKISKSGADLQIVDLPEIELKCRPIQMTQVISNLINNAADIVKELDEKWIRVEAKQNTDNIEISVTDSGKISKDLAEKIFTPLFTTKGKGEGTGLGLYLAEEIVLEHGGTLKIDTDAPNTKFVMRFPIE